MANIDYITQKTFDSIVSQRDDLLKAARLSLWKFELIAPEERWNVDAEIGLLRSAIAKAEQGC